ncbi:hypothetical protein EVA_03542 [gut metagenome]|uniref:Uncharacterized protein n=1 Tax=gut metagenome TaxID=749906 RepID=J9H3S7_9ZZZZ
MYFTFFIDKINLIIKKNYICIRSYVYLNKIDQSTIVKT